MVKHAVRTAHVCSHSKFIYPCSVFVYVNTCILYNSVNYGTRHWWKFEWISVNMHWRSLIKRGSHMAEEFILSTHRSQLTAHEFSLSCYTFQSNITTNLPYKITLLFCLVETVSTWTCVEKYEKKNINNKFSAQKKSNDYSMLCWMLPNKVWISCAFAFFSLRIRAVLSMFLPKMIKNPQKKMIKIFRIS